MSNDTDSVTTTIERTLALTAERAGDIREPVYARFFERAPAAKPLLDFVDTQVLGRMLDEICLLLLSDPADWPDDYLRFEAANHLGYGVDPSMYTVFLDAVVATVCEALGDAWSDADATAWRLRQADLIAALNRSADAAREARATAAAPNRGFHDKAFRP